MKIIEIRDVNDARASVYARLTERQLRCDDIFIAESEKVICRALAAGYQPISMLAEEGYDFSEIGKYSQNQNLNIYIGQREVLSLLTGYELSRGLLCAMHRKGLPSAHHICQGAHRVLVLDNVVEATNVGLMFRTAAALDTDAVLLTPNCCDPLCRRAVRVSMGNVFNIPWSFLASNEPVPTLHELNFHCLALALRSSSIAIEDPRLAEIARLAIIMGNEGDGLPSATIDACDFTATIPMKEGVDSLNVGAAAAIALWQLRFRQ